MLGGGGATAYFVFGGSKDEKQAGPVTKPLRLRVILTLNSSDRGYTGGGAPPQALRSQASIGGPGCSARDQHAAVEPFDDAVESGPPGSLNRMIGEGGNRQNR